MWQQLNVHAHKRRLLFALMATCLLMILLAYASLIPKFTKIELSSKEDTWSAGNWSAPQTTSADETYLIEHPLWVLSNEANAALNANTKQAVVINWKLKGVVKDGKGVYALIEIIDIANSAPKYLRAQLGDKLPNGESLVGIAEQKITIEVNQQTSEVRLYQNSKNGKP